MTQKTLRIIIICLLCIWMISGTVSEVLYPNYHSTIFLIGSLLLLFLISLIVLAIGVFLFILLIGLLSAFISWLFTGNWFEL